MQICQFSREMWEEMKKAAPFFLGYFNGAISSIEHEHEAILML